MPTSRAGILAASPGPATAGFTLIELTIVLVVLGISAGLVLPALSGLLAREGEKTAARLIQGTLRRARAEALLTGREWRVDIDWAAGRCRASQVERTPFPAPARQIRSQAQVQVQRSTAGRDAVPGRGGAAAKDGQGMVVTTDLPSALRPRLVLTEAGVQADPDVTGIVLRPEGLCQPAFIRLPDAAGREAAITVSAVGCRVDLAHADLDRAQERFDATHGQPRLFRADALPEPRS